MSVCFRPRPRLSVRQSLPVSRSSTVQSLGQVLRLGWVGLGWRQDGGDCVVIFVWICEEGKSAQEAPHEIVLPFLLGNGKSHHGFLGAEAYLTRKGQPNGATCASTQSNQFSMPIVVRTGLGRGGIGASRSRTDRQTCACRGGRRTARTGIGTGGGWHGPAGSRGWDGICFVAPARAGARQASNTWE
jgi:hypothetical protein